MSEVRHVPEVASQRDGKWGVFCAACSHEAGDYVYPCRFRSNDEWPPPNLYELLPGAEKAVAEGVLEIGEPLALVLNGLVILGVKHANDCLGYEMAAVTAEVLS